MPEHIQAIEKYLSANPQLGKPALVELLMKRFPTLSQNEAWIIVARYFNIGESSGQPGECLGVACDQAS